MLNTKDYVEIADILRVGLTRADCCGQTRRQMAEFMALEIAALCSRQNKRFSRPRFFAQCGLEELT